MGGTIRGLKANRSTIPANNTKTLFINSPKPRSPTSNFQAHTRIIPLNAHNTYLNN